MAASKSEKVSDGAPVTQPTLGEDDDLVSQTLPLIHWSYSETEWIGEAQISLVQSWIDCMKDAIERCQPP